jgi:hypothetical protein
MLDCNAVCDPNAQPMVCLNGRMSFNNECMLKLVACQKSYIIKNITEGPCLAINDVTKGEME